MNSIRKKMVTKNALPLSRCWEKEEKGIFHAIMFPIR